MRNTILEKIASIFLRAMLLLSLWVLLRGHNEPGGGFIAGILAASGFILYGIVYGSVEVERILRWNTRNWIGTGLLIILISSIIPVLLGQPVMSAVWMESQGWLNSVIHIGTPVFIDIGIYIAVIGVILSIVITIMEVLKWNS